MARPRLLCALCFLTLALLSVRTEAFEPGFDLGLSGGAVFAGVLPQYAVSLQGRASGRAEPGIVLAADDMVSVLFLPNSAALGVQNHTSVTVGYASENFNFGVGPSLSEYSMIACSITLCGRVTGIGAGGTAQARWFPDGWPVGGSLLMNIDWFGGRSRVLHNDVATTFVLGLVIRWTGK